MREYIENKIENLRCDIEMQIRLYKGAITGLRETVATDINEDEVEKWGFNYPIDPDNTHAKWVGVQYKEICRRAEYLQEAQKKLLLMLEIQAELDKYESPGTVTVDDAARKIVSNMKQARLHAKRLTLKKDEADRRYYHGLEDAYQKALLEMGYTNEQIEEMAK